MTNTLMIDDAATKAGQLCALLDALVSGYDGMSNEDRKTLIGLAYDLSGPVSGWLQGAFKRAEVTQ
ncbi:hypothetical protein MF265_22320 [Serratia marcescens]|uniref:hypothetical protein n=1 Tax=Serratia marcescens TaxID=615 RepID=UPI001EEF9581|nr:hypothetical protein [Serratia marcescens]ULH10622.1 hypothetical protein MF265_22320 [Serratia marcescens]